MMREQGLRPTKARLRILKLLLEGHNHLSAEEIQEYLRDQGYRIGLATLYQNLSRLTEENLLVRFNGRDGLIRYDATLEPHHHVHCLKCGRITDVQVHEDQLRNLQPVSLEAGSSLQEWDLQELHLELRGLCPSCRD